MVGWHRRLNGHEFEQTPGRWRRPGKPGVLQFTGHRVGHDLVTEQQLGTFLSFGKLMYAFLPGIESGI